jgi:NodT family efflux transporter outer membrane factor (OMF) lipoprotein
MKNPLQVRFNAWLQPGVSVLTLGILVSGCSVGPNYHAPKIAISDRWSEPLEGGATNGTTHTAQWWTTFNDPELNSLIVRAVQSNYDLRIAQARLRQTRAQRRFAAADLWPTLDASGSYTRERANEHGVLPVPPGVPLETDLYQAGFDAAWEIDVFGGKRRALEAATADVAASEEDLNDTLVSLLGEVARNYIEARGLQQRLVITRDNIKSQQDAVDITRARFKGGVASELDVTQAAALLASTRSQLPSLETSRQQTLHQLALLLGQQPGALLTELSEQMPIPPIPPEVPVGLPSELLRHRPDVRRAERQLAAATAQIGVQTAELFPKFSLTSSAGLQSVSASDWFTGGSRFWSVGPTVQWRVLDFGRIRANINVANAQQEEALAVYERTVLTSLQDVENALVAYAKEQVRYRSLKDETDADQRAVELANELYTKGLADFLNVLDAQRSLYQAQDQLVQSQKNVSQNLVALYKALGGGWETERRVAQAHQDQP